MKTNILITGGTGFIGRHIKSLLLNNGYDVAVLSRNKNLKSTPSYYWNYKTGELDIEALRYADIIINLAGENISSKRWTAAQKKEIYNSRILSTRLLYNKIKETGLKPKKFISASAIGFYGTETTSKIYTEEDPPGKDFLAGVVKDWEREMKNIENLGIDTLIYRLGVVFYPYEGALKEILKPLKFGFSFPLGDGQQYVAWVSVHDVARAFLYGVTNRRLKGIYNLVSPAYIRQKELMKQLAGDFFHFYIPYGIPSFLISLLKGEMASIILKGSRVSPAKLENEGFVFKDRTIKNLLI